MDFQKYKPYLIQYLRLKGIEAKRGLIRCFSPAHEDKNPSCEISDESFICYSCGIHGDIYDAVEVLTGITDKKAQFEEIEKAFGNGQSAEVLKKNYAPREKKETFTPDPLSAAKLEKYLKSHKDRLTRVNEYLCERAQIKTNGGLHCYPPAVQKEMAPYLYYWPGYTIAEAELGWRTLTKAGIPGRNPEKGNKSSWESAGVVLKGYSGSKLNWYAGGESEKSNTKGPSPFPFPSELPKGENVVFVEGEFDAIACRAAGIPNVFATCGKFGITVEKAKKFIVPKNIPEITFFADKDGISNGFGGQKMFGLLPFDADDRNKTNIPEKLIEAGYKGRIRVCVLPDDCPYKDTDEAILNKKIALVKETIENAREYKKPSTPGASLWNEYDTITIKRLRSLLRKIEYNSMDEEDTEPFAVACFKSCKNKEASSEIVKWANGNISPKQLEKKSDVTPYFILQMCDKYEVSSYLKKELEKALVPASEILRNIKEQHTVVPIDYDKMENDPDFLQFINTQGVRSAALAVASALKGKLIYVETEKRWYFFNSHVWVREPDAPGIAYTILLNLLLHYLEKNSDKKGIVNELIKRIEARRFRVELSQDLAGLKPDIFHETVPFDGPQIRETLTLLDCVADFTGKELVFRKSRIDEYRREMLPYFKKDVESAGTPEKFLKFMKGNFEDEDTLQTLLYYLSLIPSRNTGFKYGGIFLGKGGTGKSTTCNVIEAVYSGMCERIKSDVLVSVGIRRFGGNEANPEIAKLEGKCVAFAQETARNATLNTSFWKELTGGDTLTARGLYKDPHDFIPTAQIVIASNYSPKFDAHDEAAIARMIVIPFKIQHKKKAGSKTSTEFIEYLRPEFPAVVKYLTLLYIDLKQNLHGEIPLSAECEGYKGLYIEEQKTDLDNFVNDCLSFDMSGNAFVEVQKAYECYLSYYGYSAESKEALTRNKFVRFLKSDYQEIKYKQKKLNGYPELVFMNVRLSDQGIQILTKGAPQDENGMLSLKPAPSAPEPPENPFENGGFSESDSGEPDIF